MKAIKILIVSMISLMIIGLFQISNAASNVDVKLTGETEVTQDAKTVTLTISLGDFTEIPKNPIMGYEAVLEYDKDIFSSVAVEGLNNWNAQYLDSTQRLIGETISTGEPNKDIAKITLTLNENATVGTTSVKLTNGLLTVNDEDSLDFEFEKEVQITIKEKEQEQEQEQGDEEEQKEEEKNTFAGYQIAGSEEKQNSGTASNVGSSSSNSSKDKTIAEKDLPKTGIAKIAVIMILIATVGIASLIRYKSIKLK